MSNFVESRNTLQDAHRQISRLWPQAADDWRDELRARFEREFWVEYSGVVQDLCGALESLQEVTSQAERSGI